MIAQKYPCLPVYLEVVRDADGELRFIPLDEEVIGDGPKNTYSVGVYEFKEVKAG